jgi:crossover junction endonuclease MUS81
MKNFSLPEASIKQAIVNTQIIDGFFVKQTTDVKDSVDYLNDMTNYIIKIYQVN